MPYSVANDVYTISLTCCGIVCIDILWMLLNKNLNEFVQNYSFKLDSQDKMGVKMEAGGKYFL